MSFSTKSLKETYKILGKMWSKVKAPHKLVVIRGEKGEKCDTMKPIVKAIPGKWSILEKEIVKVQ